MSHLPSPTNWRVLFSLLFYCWLKWCPTLAKTFHVFPRVIFLSSYFLFPPSQVVAYIRPRWLRSSSEIHYHLISWIVFNLTIISLLTQIAFHRLLAPYAGLCLNINKSWLTWRRCQLMSFITQVFAEQLSCLFRNAQIEIAEWFWSIPWRGKVNVMCFCILHGTIGLDTTEP